MRGLRTTVAFLLVQCGAGAQLRTPPVGSARLLLLRGGADADDDAPAADKRGLTRKEIAAKLNELPTFVVTNENGGVAMFRVREKDEKGIDRFISSICFFLEPEEAKGALEAMQQAMPDAKLKLGLHGLGSAFEHCRGWHSLESATVTATAADAGDGAFDAAEPPPTTPSGEPVHMRIMGNHALVNSTGTAMRAMLADHGIESAGWTLPVFICNDLQSKSIFPACARSDPSPRPWHPACRVSPRCARSNPALAQSFGRRT